MEPRARPPLAQSRRHACAPLAARARSQSGQPADEKLDAGRDDGPADVTTADARVARERCCREPGGCQSSCHLGNLDAFLHIHLLTPNKSLR